MVYVDAVLLHWAALTMYTMTRDLPPGRVPVAYSDAIRLNSGALVLYNMAHSRPAPALLHPQALPTAARGVDGPSTHRGKGMCHRSQCEFRCNCRA